jgi:hypothetical protein
MLRRNSRRSTNDTGRKRATLFFTGKISAQSSAADHDTALMDQDSSSKDDIDSSEMDDDDLQDYLNSLVETRVSEVILDPCQLRPPSASPDEVEEEEQEEEHSIRIMEVRRRLSTRLSPTDLRPSTSSEPDEEPNLGPQEAKPFLPSAGMILLQELSTQLIENPDRFTSKERADAEAQLMRTRKRQEKETQRAAAAVAAAEAAAVAAADARAQAEAAANALSVRPSQVKRAVAEAAEMRAQAAADEADDAQARAEAAAEVRSVRPSEIKARTRAVAEQNTDADSATASHSTRAEEVATFAVAEEAAERARAQTAAEKVDQIPEQADVVAEVRTMRPSEIKAQAQVRREREVAEQRERDAGEEPNSAVAKQMQEMNATVAFAAAAEIVIADAEERVKRRADCMAAKSGDAQLTAVRHGTSNAPEQHEPLKACQSDAVIEANIPLPDMLLGLAAKVLCGFCMRAGES